MGEERQTLRVLEKGRRRGFIKCKPCDVFAQFGLHQIIYPPGCTAVFQTAPSQNLCLSLHHLPIS